MLSIHDRPTQPGNYHSYLVRLWQEQPYASWRASVQDVQTGKTTPFADLASLFAFLQAQTTAVRPEHDGSATANSSHRCDL